MRMENTLIELLVKCLCVIVASEAAIFILKHLKPGNHRLGTVISLVRSLLRYIAGVAVVWIVMDVLGFDTKTIAASVGLMTLIIGFSAESLIADLVTGVFMVFENQYNVGDILEVKGFRGTVTEMGIRTTSLMDSGGNIKIINNSEMVSILNRSDLDSTAVCDIAVAITDHFTEFEKKIPAIVNDLYEKNKDRLPHPPEYLGVQAIEGKKAVLRFIASVPEQEIYEAQRLLNHELLVRFIEAGVVWP